MALSLEIENKSTMQYLEWSESTEDNVKIAFFHCVSCQQQWHEIFSTNSISIRDCNGVNCDNKVLPHTIKGNGFGEFHCNKCDNKWIHSSILPNELKVCTNCGSEVSPLNIYADLESTAVVKHDPPTADVWSKWLEITDEYFSKHYISGIFCCEMCNVTMNSLNLVVFHTTVFHTDYGKRKIELIQGEALSKQILSPDHLNNQDCLHTYSFESEEVPLSEVSCDHSVESNSELDKSIGQDTSTPESEFLATAPSCNPSEEFKESSINQNATLNQSSSDLDANHLKSEAPVTKSLCNHSEDLEELQINNNPNLDQSSDHETTTLQLKIPVSLSSCNSSEDLEEPQISQISRLDQSIDQGTKILESEAIVAQASHDPSEECKEPQINLSPGLIKYKGPSISRGWQAWCQKAEELSQIHSLTGTFTCMVCNNDSLINPRLLAHHVASHSHTAKRLKLEGKPDPSVHQPNKNIIECNSVTPNFQQFIGQSYMRSHQGNHVTYNESLAVGLPNHRSDLSQHAEYRRDHLRESTFYSRGVEVGYSNYRGGHIGSHPSYGVANNGNRSNYMNHIQDYLDCPPASPVQRPFPPPPLHRNIPYQKPSVFQKKPSHEPPIVKKTRGLSHFQNAQSRSRQSESLFHNNKANFNYMVGSRPHIPPFPY